MRRAIYAVLLTYAVSICFCSVAYLTFAVRERAEIEEESSYTLVGPGMEEHGPNQLDHPSGLANLTDHKSLENIFEFGSDARLKSLKIGRGPQLRRLLKHKKFRQPSDKDAAGASTGLAGRTNEVVAGKSGLNGNRHKANSQVSRPDELEVEYNYYDHRLDQYADRLETNFAADDAADAGRPANETISNQADHTDHTDHTDARFDEESYRGLQFNSSHLNISKDELLKVLGITNEHLFEPKKQKTYVVS